VSLRLVSNTSTAQRFDWSKFFILPTNGSHINYGAVDLRSRLLIGVCRIGGQGHLTPPAARVSTWYVSSD